MRTHTFITYNVCHIQYACRAAIGIFYMLFYTKPDKICNIFVMIYICTSFVIISILYVYVLVHVQYPHKHTDCACWWLGAALRHGDTVSRVGTLASEISPPRFTFQFIEPWTIDIDRAGKYIRLMDSEL